MNRSPFEIFRRNQRQFMVLLTGLSMFAFVFYDTGAGRNGQLPMSLGVLSVALICAGGLWVVGSPRGKGGEWAMYGAIVGAVIAFFGFRAQTNSAAYVTTIRNFSRDDLQHLQARRVTANRFLYAATKNQFMTFGGTNDEQIVLRSIHLAEAQKMGISVSNDAVVSFIKKATAEKLSRPDYEKILRDLHIAESELFDILREEMTIDLYEQIDSPARQRFGNGMVQTPLAVWKEFQKLQVRQSMDTLAVPVAQFTSLVPEPKDSELAAYFEKYKAQRPGQTGTPGFLQDRQVQLAYVAAEFETFEKFAGEITDEDVTQFYEKNKERYRVFDIPDSPSGPAFPGDDAPVDALMPSNLEAPKAPEAPAGDAPAKPESPPEPTKPEEGSSCGVDEAAAQGTPADKPAEETTKKDEAAATEKPAEPKAAEAEKPAADLTLPPAPGGAAAETKPEEPKYKPLDDALKAEIREAIMKERAFEKMGGAIERVLAEMTRLNDDYLRGETPDARKAIGEEITKKLKAYAEEHSLKYSETKPMTQSELLNAVDEPLAMSMQPSANPFQPGSSVPEIAFDDDLLFYPRSSDAFVRDKRFAYWKIADFPAKVPEFKDVKDKVLEAWKFEMARPLAEKRAKELADLINTSKKPMKDALEGQTVNNQPDGPAIAVQKTGRFTWLNVPRNIPGQFDPRMSEPQISFVNGVDRPDNEFMKVVFDQLEPGQAGIVPNQIRSAYYVAQVTERDGVAQGEDQDNIALKALQQQFLMEGRTGFFRPEYMALSRYPLMEILMKREELVRAKYGLDDPLNKANATRDSEP